MLRYEIVPKRYWLHTDGRKASLFGASPAGVGWQLVTEGATLYDRRLNTYSSHHDDTPETIAARMDKVRPNWRAETI